jgi:DNA repair protein RadA/Sms
MGKTRIEFLCRECGANHPKWQGKCPDCGAWDSLEKFAVEVEATKPGAAPIWGSGEEGDAEQLARGGIGRAVALGEVPEATVPRIATGISEFDRVLGGGVVPGSVMLLGGDPGIGKSTLLMQVAASIASKGGVALYASSEESPQQVRLRAERLEPVVRAGGAKALGERLLVLGETNVARIVEQARRAKASIVLVDSIQLVHRADVTAAPGSIAQLRRATLDLVALAKSSGCAVILVGHVTKEGALAGPKLLEHLVDVVLGFEGDRHSAVRVVRGVKNRFGSTQEIGLFEMRGDGLAEIESVRVPLAGGPPAPGCAFVATMAGTRCLLGEVHALVATGFLGSAKRRASGLDSSRLAMLIAVLEKHGGLRLADQDVFAQALGGLKIAEPAADLAVLLAVAGAFLQRTLPQGTVAIGEVGLTGELRTVPHLEQRVHESLRRGARVVLVPASAKIRVPTVRGEGVAGDAVGEIVKVGGRSARAAAACDRRGAGREHSAHITSFPTCRARSSPFRHGRWLGRGHISVLGAPVVLSCAPSLTERWARHDRFRPSGSALLAEFLIGKSPTGRVRKWLRGRRLRGIETPMGRLGATGRPRRLDDFPSSL